MDGSPGIHFRTRVEGPPAESLLGRVRCAPGMPRPVLRLATRLTRRTRTTAWAIAFACMVLVGTLSLADGFANGVGSVADRIGSGPAVYIRGPELLASEIDVDRLSVIPGDFLALRARTGELEIKNESLPIVVVALVNYLAGNATNSFPVGARDLSLDAGLRERIQEMSERPVETVANLSLFGIRLTGLPVVPPPPSRSLLFPDTWAHVRADLLVGMDLVHGGSVQAIVTNATLDPSMVSRLGLTRLDAVGAVGFVRAGVAQIQATLQLLALVIGLVIALLVYAAMSLEVHARAREIATLRSLGATPGKVAAVYEAQAILISLAGAVLGAALGIVVAHAVVSFAPLFGFPNLVILAPPLGAIGLTLIVALTAAVVAGLVPSRRAAVLARSKGAVPS